MAKKITRTIKYSVIEACLASFTDGEIVTEELKPVRLTGVYTQEDALKELKKKLGLSSENIIIKNIEEKESKFEMDTEMFMDYAEETEATDQFMEDEF